MGALKEFFVDPSINANSGTGTFGDPFGDLQYALNSIPTIGGGKGVDGDLIHVKSSAPENLTGTLSFTTYGTPAVATPVMIRGYDSVAFDGGKGFLWGNNQNFTLISSIGYLTLVDMKVAGTLLSSTIYYLWVMGNMNRAVRCEFYSCRAAAAVTASTNVGSVVIGCHFHDMEGNSLFDGNGTGSICIGNYFQGNVINANNTQVLLFGTSGSDVRVIGNVVHCTRTTTVNLLAATVNSGSPLIMENTCLQDVAPSSSFEGIASTGSGALPKILRNIVVGCSSAASYPVQTVQAVHLVADNLYFNNTNNFADSTDPPIREFGDVVATSHPVPDRATGDYTPTAEADGLDDFTIPGTITPSAPTAGAVQSAGGVGVDYVYTVAGGNMHTQ